MKSMTKKLLSLLCATVIAAAFLCACDADPNVVQNEATADSVEVIKPEDAQDATEREGFHAYHTGKTDPVKVKDVEVAPTDFALRSYELAFMMAQKSFSDPKDLPVDAAVQYALVHVFFPDFHSINNKAVQYRSASPDEVKDELKKQFGTDDFAIKDSMLYNPSKKIFEMWTPAYGTNIYDNIDAVEVDGDKAEITTTFYNELNHGTLLGKATITVKIKDGKPVIAAVKAE